MEPALITQCLLWHHLYPLNQLKQEVKEGWISFLQHCGAAAAGCRPSWLQGKGKNTTYGGSQPCKILSSHEQEWETQSLSISQLHSFVFHTPGDINAPSGRERNPSISHISINPPSCRCAGLWLRLTATLASCRTGILPSQLLGGNRRGSRSPKGTSSSPRSYHQHFYVLTIWILSHS